MIKRASDWSAPPAVVEELAVSDDEGPPVHATRAEVRHFVLLAHEGFIRGFRNPLAFRRWCARHGVPIRRDGKRLWICVEDVDKAVAGLPIRSDGSRDDAVAASVAAIVAKVK